jgi:hypothetical protein
VCSTTYDSASQQTTSIHVCVTATGNGARSLLTMRKSENRGAIRRTTPVPVNASATVHVGIYRIEGAAPETVKRMPQTQRPPNLEEPLPACAGPAAVAVHAQTESRGARVREQEREEYPVRAPLDE